MIRKKDTPLVEPLNQSYMKTIGRRFLRHRLAVISLYFLTALILLALFAPVISPYDPNKIAGKFSAPPSSQFLLGTDQVGRDVLTRLLYATRVSLLVGFASTAIATAIGVVLGLISGYFGGWLDMVIMRITDMVMSFPYIAGTGGSLHFSAGPYEHHSHPWLCGLARRGQACPG